MLCLLRILGFTQASSRLQTVAWMPGFGYRSTADQVLQGKDLTGKRAFVTGGTSGLGHETVRALVGHGCHVVFTTRTKEV